ncbi:ABC transporter permease, partial [Gemmatimonadota bacterium]
MRASFVLGLAWREGRSSLSRIWVYLISIALGVGALISVHSFRADVTRAIGAEARFLLGADAKLMATGVIPDSVRALVDSLEEEGVRSTSLTSLMGMVHAPRSGKTLLFQIVAAEPDYPFYGEVRTNPDGAWTDPARDASALVDRALLSQLEVAVGDTLWVGRARFPISGVVEELPTDLGPQAILGPRVFIPGDSLRATGL